MKEILCGKKASYRYTWPGRDEADICEECSQWMRTVASAMGLHLQLIPLGDSERICSQRKKEGS